jgi:hypothetical protein
VYIKKSAALLALSIAALSVPGVAVGAGTNVVFGSHHAYKGSFSGGNWGGYVSTGSYTTATASWVEPSVSCTSTNDLVAPWVGIDGDGSSTVEQAGVATDCSSGSAVYSAWYEMYPASPVYYSDSVSAGDSFTGTVTYLGSKKYKLVITDNTKGWTHSTTQTLSAQNLTAEAIIESPTDSYPTISGGAITFTGVKFNGTALADTSPAALSADDKGTGTWTPGSIGSDGESFSLTES